MTALSTVLQDLAGILVGAGGYHVTKTPVTKAVKKIRPSPITCYDGVTVSALPEGDCYLAYVNGPFENVGTIRARFPKARIITVATDPEFLASILDIETGAAIPKDFAAWHAMCKDHGIYKPGAYASKYNGSAWQAVNAVPASERQSIVADWTGEPHLIKGRAGCQYKNTSGYDVSLLAPGWFG
jgi:hypothetical protein